MNIKLRYSSLLLAVFLLSGLIFWVSEPVAAQQQTAITPRKTITGDGTLRRIRVPILMYHYISELPEDADDIRTELTVDPAVFRNQMQYLHDQGYSTISMYDLHEALLNGAELPPMPVILTFDDGYIDHYTNVLPILQSFGFTGTFFIITGRVDAGDPAYVTWDQIVEMAQIGMDMESHTKSHFDLRSRDYSFLVYEILGSIESLEAHTGIETRIFCYPAGRYDDYTLEIMATLPIWRAVTTRNGTLHTTDNDHEMPRLRISRSMGLAGFIHALNSY